jgi:Ca2+-transporting ATPase
LNQFKSPLIYLLFLAGAIVFLIDEPIDAFIIFAVLIFNAIIGTIQEGKAKNALLALNKFVTTKATVLREGKELIIPDTEVVFGDIIILNEGEKIPADARIIISNNLKIDEATMTGESNPVSKTPEVLKSESLDIGDPRKIGF